MIVLIAAIILLLSLAGLLVHAVLKGYIWTNHPSGEAYPVWGIDVSHYQGEISAEDWKKLIDGELKAKGHEIDFAYMKATEGSSHVDKRFGENWTAVRDSLGEFRAGAYHFFSFESAGITQLENYTNRVTFMDGMLPPAVDLEFYAGNENNPPDKTSILRELTVMLDGLEQTYHMIPIIYVTEESYDYFLSGEEAFNRYPLWVRNVITKPKKLDRQWTIWQFTNKGMLKDEEGAHYFGSEQEPFVDINVFYGDTEEFGTDY